MNFYSYVQNNPIMYIDPSGHWAKWLDDIADWVRDKANDVKDWCEDNHVGEYLYTGVEVVGGAATTVVSGAGIFLSSGTAAPAYVSLAHGVNSVVNGIKDIGHIMNNDFDSVGSENFLRDNVYEPVGKGIGYGVGKTVDSINKGLTKKETNYSDIGMKIGEDIGTLGYYGVDIFGGASGINSSIKAIKASKYTKIFTKYYEGNDMVGYVLRNDLKVPSDITLSAKIYAGGSAILDSANISYDIKDIYIKYIGNSEDSNEDSSEDNTDEKCANK